MAPAKTLYERLGGAAALTAVVDDFVANVAADKRINHFFAKTDIPAFKKNLTDQLCAATGGPCYYIGRDMKTAHTGLGITEDDWNASVKLLVAALDKYKKEHADDDALGVAEVYAYVGDKDHAFTWLERAYRQKDIELYLVKVNPMLTSLRGDPRFKAFLRKMNLPE